jgi:hypothetical protein
MIDIEYLIGLLALGTLQQFAGIWKDRQNRKTTKAEAEEARTLAKDEADARSHQVVAAVNTAQDHLGAAIAENTKVSVDAFEVGNNVNQKLLAMDAKLAVAIPETAAILTEMMQSGSQVSQADIARVLVAIQRKAMADEKYMHDSVHAINNLIAVMQADAKKKGDLPFIKGPF